MVRLGYSEGQCRQVVPVWVPDHYRSEWEVGRRAAVGNPDVQVTSDIRRQRLQVPHVV